MSWKVRHEGSPRSVEGLTAQQVVEGLRDNLWEPTDEVMGPNDGGWQAIENHPQFAEVALDLEPPPPRYQEDESRLDMNPLIDVALVLLIFFILVTSYAALQKYLEGPGSKKIDPKTSAPVISKAELEKTTVKVTAGRKPDGSPLIKVEDTPVSLEDLEVRLADLRKSTKKGEIWLNISDDATYGTEIAVRNAAKGAGYQKVLIEVASPDTNPKR